MQVTNYHTINSILIGETSNGTRTDYLSDALGSVTSTVNQSASIVNTYRYKPYGGLLAKTGIGTDPAFGWIGQHGYRKTETKFSRFYVRSRHYASEIGRWTTKDPLAYARLIATYIYCRNRPTVSIDPSGKFPQVPQAIMPSCQQPNCCTPRNIDWYFNVAIESNCKNGWEECPDNQEMHDQCGNFLSSWVNDPEVRNICEVAIHTAQMLSSNCSFACAGKGFYRPDTQLDAATFCCYDRGATTPRPCATRCCRRKKGEPNRYNDMSACIAYCLNIHEGEHLDSEACNTRMRPPGLPELPVIPVPQDECCPYARQVKCLLDLIHEFLGQYCNIDPESLPDVSACWKAARKQGCNKV